jgi:dTDP-4-dehydrorhamnose reductase
MKILIIGANGQVGNEIFKLFKKKKYNCIPISRKEWDMSINPEYGYTLTKEYKPEIIINAAAYTDVEKAENDINNLSLVNVKSLEFLLKGCKEFDIPFIHISSDYVFDGMKNKPYLEYDVANPINEYGKSKLSGENLVQQCSSYLILRTSWVFSKKGKNFVNTIKEKLNNNENLKIISDQFGNPTSANSIANCLLKIIEKYKKEKEFISGIYHFTGLEKVSWYEFAVFLKNILNSKSKINQCNTEDYPSKVKRPKNSVLSCIAIKQIFGIEQVSWKKELQKLILKK